MVLTNDEGIVLESAQRMAAGGRLYVDFFGYMSPGSYWLQALVFQLFGFALWTGRLLVILDFALQCALVYWLAARLASWRAAAAVALTFAGFQVADPAFLTSAHRWDSATFALAGLCLAVSALTSDGRARWWRWFASGAALGAAAWCTPSMAAVAVLVGAWIAASSERRRNLVPLAVGVAVAGLAGIIALAASGSIAAFVGQMAWLQRNYAASNVFPYGSVIGGYRSLFEGTSGFADLLIRGVLVACLALPAVLPPAAILLWGLVLWRGRRQPESAQKRPVIQMLLLSVAGLVITVFPRADVTHLAFIVALPYVLAGTALARWLPARAGSYLALGAIMLAAVFASNYFRGWRELSPVPSPAGILRVARDQAPGVERLMQEVHPGDSLFVYPYMPVQYFLTQAHNPTRFSYLQPGLMTREQAREALSQLQSRPPEWLLYLQLSQEEFRRVFPNGADLDWHFAELESWMQRNYVPVEGPSVSVGGYRLWRRAPAPEAAALRQ
jgi:4-amino-4-deoxy-L-arabinose transferase-like glycosyltransferase